MFIATLCILIIFLYIRKKCIELWTKRGMLEKKADTKGAIRIIAEDPIFGLSDLEAEAKVAK